MNKKNEKKLCWNCDGSVSLQMQQCPYCGVDFTTLAASSEETSPFSFQKSITPSEESNTSYLGHPFQRSQQEEAIPQSPYGNFQNLGVSDEEWKKALEGEESSTENAEEEIPENSTKNEMIALLLLLPGIVFFLFGLILMLFSDNGVLTLEWNQSFAYFYFLGAIPLLILGWRAFR